MSGHAQLSLRWQINISGIVIKLNRLKILDFIISGCILYTKISRMVIFGLVFLVYFLKLSVGNGFWNIDLLLLDVVTHPGKLECYHVVLVGYSPACPKFSEIINGQYLWRGLSDFVDFLYVVNCILLDIHWS